MEEVLYIDTMDFQTKTLVAAMALVNKWEICCTKNSRNCGTVYMAEQQLQYIEPEATSALCTT